MWDTNQKEVEYIVMRHRFKTPLRPDQVARYGGANKASHCEAVGLPMYYTDIQTPKDTRTVTPTGNLAPETPVYKKAKQEAVAGLQKVAATSMLPFLKAPTHARMAAQGDCSRSPDVRPRLCRTDLTTSGVRGCSV